MIIDTHAHLTYKGLAEDTKGVVSRANAAGVGIIVTVGIGVDDCRKAVEVAQKYDCVYASVGVHPHDAGSMTNADLKALGEMALLPKVVAIGEAGLDYYRDLSPRDLQRKWFRAQAGLARELGKPLVVHDRDAHEETFAVLEAEAAKGLKGVMHCFSGDVALMEKVLGIGFCISIPGTVTYPSNATLKEVVKKAPLEKLMLETDCPFLSPQKFRGKTNEPALIVHTAEEVARLKGLSFADVARITTRTAGGLFGIQIPGEAKLAYPIRNSLYINITDRCTNACVFCPKGRSKVVKGHNLVLSSEPGAEEVLEAVKAEGDIKAWDEVVFCGFGEPLTRLDLVKELARKLKALGAKKIRVNTDGLANLVHGRDVTGELKGAVDAVSISLNAADPDTYRRICKPSLPDAYEGVKDFIAKAKSALPEVTATAVAMPGIDVDAIQKIAQDLGVAFRSRPYNDLG